MFRATQVPSQTDCRFRVRGFHPLRPSFPEGSPTFRRSFDDGPTTPAGASPHRGFGLLRVRSPLLAQSLLFSFPPATEMFQFTGFAPHLRAVTESLPPGCPIRKSAHHRVFAPPRGLSQLVTSFFAFESLGILHVPFSPFLLSLYAWRFTRRRSDSSLRFYRLLCYSFSLLEFCFHNVNVLCWVENNGFEPLTPCLQSRCSSQLS